MVVAPPGEGRVALVTGSTSGIGLAIARRLAADGFAVALHSRASVAAGMALAAEFGAASYSAADLADEAAARGLIGQVIERHGRLDVLVNNAGISRLIPHLPLKNATPAVWREFYEVNVVAPWILVSEAEPFLRKSAEDGRSSAIVNISSHAGVRPRGASIPYAASKAALNHTTRLLALALAPAIRVNAIAPGLVDTPLTRGWTEIREGWATRAPMRRAAQPEDIAALTAMAIASDYLTGEIILADGGYNMT